MTTELISISKDHLKKVAQSLDDQHQIDEMAVPSYCHSNILIQKFFWSRLSASLTLLKPAAGEKIWDFGTGTGILLPTLSRTSSRVYASDLFTAPAKKLIELYQLTNVEFFKDPIPDPHELSDHSLDAIIALDSLEHVDELDQKIGFFKKALKPEGRMVICGPTETFLYKVGRIVAGFSGKEEYHHTTIHHIFDVIKNHGFKQKKIKKLFPWPFMDFFHIGLFKLD